MCHRISGTIWAASKARGCLEMTDMPPSLMTTTSKLQNFKWMWHCMIVNVRSQVLIIFYLMTIWAGLEENYTKNDWWQQADKVATFYRELCFSVASTLQYKWCKWLKRVTKGQVRVSYFIIFHTIKGKHKMAWEHLNHVNKSRGVHTLNGLFCSGIITTRT